MLLDGRERFETVDVPGDLVEHSQEGVDRDESHTRLDQPAGQQAALAEPVHAIATANDVRFVGQVKRRPGLLACRQAVGLVRTAVQPAGGRAGFKVLDRGVDRVARIVRPDLQHPACPAGSAINANGAYRSPSQPAPCPDGMSSPPRPIGSGSSTWAGRLLRAPRRKLTHAAGVGRGGGLLVQTTRLTELPSRLVYGGPVVMTRPYERQLVAQCGRVEAVSRKHWMPATFVRIG